MFDFLDDLFTDAEDVDFAIDEELRPGMAHLRDLIPGTEFLIGDEVYIALEHTDMGESRVIRKELLHGSREFGSNADWKRSSIRDYLNGEYYDGIAAIVGSENVIHTQRDLTSLDGLTDYGVVIDKVSLLTASEYAKYHHVLGVRSNYRNWWWTITPFSTPSNDYSRGVCCVISDGALDWLVCDDRGGVRPFLTLNSSLLVSLLSENEVE